MSMSSGAKKKQQKSPKYVFIVSSADNTCVTLNLNTTLIEAAPCKGTKNQLWTYTGKKKSQWKNEELSRCLKGD